MDNTSKSFFVVFTFLITLIVLSLSACTTPNNNNNTIDIRVGEKEDCTGSQKSGTPTKQGPFKRPYLW